MSSLSVAAQAGIFSRREPLVDARGTVPVSPDPAVMAALARMAERVAHDVNNMMSSITVYGELLREQLPADSPAAADAEGILGAAARMADLTRDLYGFARPRPGYGAEPVDLREVIAEMRASCEGVLGPEHPLLLVSGPERVITTIAPLTIEAILRPVLENARDAAPAGRPVTISVNAGRQPSGAELTIEDEGGGVPERLRDRLFEPFTTTKGGTGRGLGLATAWRLAEGVGGTIAVRASARGTGTCVVIRFPSPDERRS